MARPPVEICRGMRPSEAPKSLPLENTSPLPIAATVAVDDRANARYRHEELGTVILLGQRLDLVQHGRDASIEIAPVRTEVLDHLNHAGRQLVHHEHWA